MEVVVEELEAHEFHPLDPLKVEWLIRDMICREILPELIGSGLKSIAFRSRSKAKIGERNCMGKYDKISRTIVMFSAEECGRLFAYGGMKSKYLDDIVKAAIATLIHELFHHYCSHVLKLAKMDNISLLDHIREEDEAELRTARAGVLICQKGLLEFYVRELTAKR